MTDISNIPGWIALAIILFERIAIPLLNRYLPFKQAKEKRDHEAFLEEKQHEREIDERLVKALETTSNNLARLTEQNLNLQAVQNQILITQNKQSEALAILVDRVARDDVPHRKGK